MKNMWYKITGISPIVLFVWLIYTTTGQALDRSFRLVYLCNFLYECPESLGIGINGIFLSLDYVITLLIFIIFLIQGIYYFRMNEEKKTKLLNWSANLSLTASIIFILTILFFWIDCLPQGGFHSTCFAYSSVLATYLLYFAGILYLISLTLLIINWFKTR